MFFVFFSIPDQYKTQEVCDKVVSEYTFLTVYCPDKYKTQRRSDEAVHDSLAAPKLIPDWFVTVKCLKNVILLYMQMKMHSTLTKILVMSYFLVMEWVLLI